MTTPTVSTSANDLVTGALRKIGALAAGEVPNANDSSDALQVLNDMIESWSTDKLFVFAGVENILTWTPGQYQYTVGNPVAGTFVGLITSGVTAIVGVTLPVNLVVGATITDPSPGSGLIQANTLVTSIVSVNSGNAVAITFTGAPTGSSATLTGGWGFATGIYQITFSDGEQRAATLTSGNTAVTWTPALVGTPTASASVNPNTVNISLAPTGTVSDTLTYTSPGNFAIPRPLRIPRAFTRITSSGTTGLDYEINVDYTGDKYNAIGLKGVPGPWPILLWYNPTFPLGNLYCYPNPQLGGSLHLWTDTIFTDFTNPAQSILLPQGYALAIKLSLALLLAPEYGKAGGVKLTLLQQQAREAVERIKKLNATPAVQAFFDRDIVRTRRTDAGWIFHGGFT
jgi:hypothetical protein